MASTNHKPRQTVEQTPKSPILLYNDPHPVHAEMADAINADLVPATQGGIIDRVKAAAASSYQRPILLEGGVPLVEGAVVKLLRRTDAPVILLAADETQHNIHDPLPYYSRAERLAHRAAHRFIDGAIAVSERTAEYTESLINGPVETTHPFILPDRYDRLRELDPALDSQRVLCVGKYRPSNNQDALVKAAQQADTDIHVDLVGEGTTDAPAADCVTRHGFVDDDTLIDLYGHAALFAFPARAGAYPVSTLEAHAAGIPTWVSDRVGTQTLASRLHTRFVGQPWGPALANDLDWYFNQPVSDREVWSEQARELGAEYQADTQLARFKEAYQQVVKNA